MGHMLRLVLWCLWGLWLSLPTALVRALPLVPRPPVFAFAQSLFTAGEYYRAIGEFQRFLFFQPEHPLAAEAQLTIGLAYFCGERWLQAFEVFRRIARTGPDNAMQAEAALWMAETHARTIEGFGIFQRD